MFQQQLKCLMRNSFDLRRLIFSAGVCALLCTINVFAAEDNASDPPDRVARLSYASGQVALQATNEDSWSDASINRPLTTGDRLKLESNARAELQAGELDVHVDQRSDFSFLELSDTVAQFQLTAGALHLSVRNLRENEVVEVDTPQAAVTITKPGEYSIALRDGIRTLVKTYAGECEVSDHANTIALKTGQEANFFASELNASRNGIEPVEPRTAFEEWAYDRNRGYDRSASARYVAPDVIGYRDLDNYGDWMDDSDYGHVWYPTHVAVDWTPYSLGHWAWISPWGWTWVDDAPWGFAPFHYGRWAHVRGRWCWVPGPVHVHPVYAPALVVWVGAPPPRGGISVSVGFGAGIGWFPLAPREVFVPSYPCSRTHIHDVNYSNTIVNNIYINRVYNDRSIHFEHVNRQVAGAITVMRPDAFAASRSVRDHRVAIEPHELQNWQTRNVIPEVRPTHVNVVRPSTVIAPRSGEPNVVMRHAPFERSGQSPNAAIARERADLPLRRNGAQSDPRVHLEDRPQNRTPIVTPAPRNTGANIAPPRDVHREPPAEVRREFSRDPRAQENRAERVEQRPVEIHAAPPEINRPQLQPPREEVHVQRPEPPKHNDMYRAPRAPETVQRPTPPPQPVQQPALPAPQRSQPAPHRPPQQDDHGRDSHNHHPDN